MRAGLGIDHIVDVALPPDGDVFRLVLGDGDVTHACEELAQLFGLGVSEFNKFEAIGAGRIVRADFRRRRIMRKRTHFLLQRNLHFDYAKCDPKRMQCACILDG